MFGQLINFIHYERSKLEEATKFFSEKMTQKGLSVTYHLEKQLCILLQD